MSKREKLTSKLREEALGHGGRVSLASMLEVLVPVGDLRDLAREHGVTPKGGFRLEKAPARVLAPALSDTHVPEVLEEACELLAQHMVVEATAKTVEPVRTREPSHLQPVLKLKEQELVQAKADLEKSREVAQGLRDRVDELNRQLEQAQQSSTLLAKEVDACREEIETLGKAQPVVARDQSKKILSLEKELEEQNQFEMEQRRKLSEQVAMIRERDERIAELEELIPPGKRRKKKVAPPQAPEGFIVPRFTQAFLKSLAGKDRRAIEHAYRAVFLLCTEGSRHPGLQVKSLDPGNVWSLRASRKLRVYFRRLPDGDIEILDLLDRQEQDTMLRRYREKQ